MRKVVIAGYIYTKHRDGNDGYAYWHCVRRHGGVCHGRVKIHEGNETFDVVIAHSHLPSFGAAKAVVATAGFNRRAREEPQT